MRLRANAAVVVSVPEVDVPEFMDRPADLDLGGGVRLWWFGWHPDRELNPQYADLPDLDRAGALIVHGNGCYSGINFRSPGMERAFPEHATWVVESWDPLTLSPSLLCRTCGWHVFIRDGKAVTC